MKKINYVVMTGVLSVFIGCGDVQPYQEIEDYTPPPVVKVKPKPKPKVRVQVTGAAGELKRLTFGGVEEFVDDVSKNGKWLLIDTYSKNKNGDKSNTVIQKLNIKNNMRMILTPTNSSNWRANWADNDTKFVFSTDRAGVTIAESMGVNGEQGVRFITTAAMGKSYNPNYSQKLNEVTFTLNGNIAIININGTSLRMFGQGNLPKFSPNGKRVLFIRNDGNYDHIYIMNNNGTGLMEITNENANDTEAVWSPDGKKIAFISDRTGKYRHLFVMDITGRNLIQLTNGNYNVTSLNWGRDGYIYFSANVNNNNDIWRLKIK